MASHAHENGYSIWRESEHQELWYAAADMTRPIPVHIPSALGTLGYYVCIKGPAAWADGLGGVAFKAEIGGLRPDDIHLEAGEGLDDERRLPSRTEGAVWHLLCRARMSRGDGTIEFVNWQAEFGPADVLLCTWPRYITSGQADQWLECQADPRWAPTGIPLGGIGCGRVDLCRDGRLRNFSGNNNQDVPLEEPAGLDGAFLAVTEGDDTVALTTAPVGDIPGCGALDFDGRFPQAQLRASVFEGIDVTVTGSGMICPHDLRRSAMPGVLLRWRVKNTSSQARRIACSFSWPNLIGIGGGIGEAETDIGKGDGVYCDWEETDGQRQDRCDAEGFAAVVFSSDRELRRPNAAGRHVLAVGKSADAEAWAEPQAGRGRVGQTLTLQPGEARTADMALVWEMPRWVDALGTDNGHLWQNYFDDGLVIVAELLENADDILAQTGALAALPAETSLPDWLKRRLSNCNYPLVTNSVLYRDGRFSINEGPTEMVGCYGTIDQRLGAHPATQLLFPELNDKELTEFGDYQSGNGGINHDLGHGHLDSGPRDQPWPDIPCSFVIQCARHAWSTGDERFEERMWPKARKALLRDAIWAEAGDGVAQTGRNPGTSYDGYHYEGTTPYLGTLWLAALAVMEKWSTARGDDELLGKIPEWRRAALERMAADLWNGSFYRTCGSAGGPMRETSHAGQLAGQVYTHLLTGGNVVPDDRLGGCVEALMHLNGSDRYAVPPDEVSPDGEEATEYGWLPYVEAFGLSAAATVRDARVLPVWERVVRAMDQGGARLCDTRLMYRPTTGEPSWGSYYMTAPASWLVYEALLDFWYEPGEGVLRLNPQLEGTVAVVHPLWWALADVDAKEITLRFVRTSSGRPLEIRRVEVPGADGAIVFDAPVRIAPGSTLNWGR